jgi:hypothetical protein
MCVQCIKQVKMDQIQCVQTDRHYSFQTELNTFIKLILSVRHVLYCLINAKIGNMLSRIYVIELN